MLRNPAQYLESQVKKWVEEDLDYPKQKFLTNGAVIQCYQPKPISKTFILMKMMNRPNHTTYQLESNTDTLNMSIKVFNCRR